MLLNGTMELYGKAFELDENTARPASGNRKKLGILSGRAVGLRH